MAKSGERQAKQAVKKAAHRSLERALQEERLALSAITKAMLAEVDDPRRVLARLEAMARAADANPKVSRAVGQRLLDATRFVRAAIEREVGMQPEATLFDPPGVVAAAKVDAIVNGSVEPEQLGFDDGDSLLGDVEEAQRERVKTLDVVHLALVDIFRDRGAMSDRELHRRYVLLRSNGQPPQSPKAIVERRKELVATGRVTSAGRVGADTTWDLVERAALRR